MHRIRRFLFASLLTLAFLGMGLLALFVPRVIPYAGFGWAAAAYLLAVGCFSMGFRRPTMRFLAAVLGGFLVLHTYPYFITYHVMTDQMAPQLPGGPIHPPAFLGLLGGWVSYLPAWHCLWVERQLTATVGSGWPTRMIRGVQISLWQAGKVLLGVAPLLFFAPVGLSIVFAPTGPGMLPLGVSQYFYFLIAAITATLAAATILGAAAGLIQSLAPTVEKSPPPPEDIADVLGPGPDQTHEPSHLDGLAEVIRHR